MTGLRSIVALTACACLALWVAAACGGTATSTGSPTPRSSTVLSFLDIPGASVSVTPTPTPAPTRSGRAVVQADLSSAVSPQTTIEKLEQVIQDRLGDAGVHSNISQTSDAELTIDFTGARSTDFVKQVTEAQNLNFRQPIIQADGQILCKATGGNEFSVPATSVKQIVDDAGRKFVSCTASDGTFSAAVEWEPAQADVNGETKTLAQSMIDASKAEITSTPQQGTVLLLTFTPEGTSLFTALTGRLAHYPLGMFLRDALLSAPTVFAQITTPQTEISGASDDELAAAKAVLKGGELPVPVSVTSIEPDLPLTYDP
jgi:Preprotein translocase subunit SecD